MSLKKTAKQDAPHAVFVRVDAGWEWRVLKTYKSPESEEKDRDARWLLAVKSPFTHGQFEIGDTWIRELMDVNPVLTECTREFAAAYMEHIQPRTIIRD